MFALSLPEILLYGLAMSATLCVMLLIVLAINPRMMLHDAPPEVQANVPPQTPTEKRQAILLAVPIFSLIALIFAHSSAQVIARSAGSPDFFALFFNAFLIFEIGNLFDLVVIDYLVLMVWKPKFVIVPGWEGITNVHTLDFHVRGFFKGTVMGVVIAIVVALITIALV